MFYLIGIAIDFFLMILLAGKKNKSDADKILAAWLFFIGLHLSLFYLFITKQDLNYPQLLGIGIPFPLLHGPFLYLYTTSLTSQEFKRNFRILHFLPFAFAYIPLIPFLLSSAEHKIYTFTHDGEGYEWIMISMNIIIKIQGITYVILSLLKLRRHKINISDQFSNTEKINLRWLRYIIYGMSIIWIVVLYGKDEPIYAAVVLFVFFLGYFGIKQTGIFTYHPPIIKVYSTDDEKKEDNIENPPAIEPEINIEPEKESDNDKEKYQKSGLNEFELQRIHSQLTSLMEKEKLYTNPELTLGETAQQLNIHPNYLSQVINSVSKKNFYDYINSQRVEEFNRIVIEPKNQKFTLLSLAFECGFNSKTSFNRNFRKVMGQSPSDYLKQMNVRLEQAG